MHPVRAFMAAKQQMMIDELIQWVQMESPSLDKSSVDLFSRHLAAQFAELGARVEVLPRDNRGDLLRVTWGEGHEEGQTLVLSHMDTVFAVGDIAKNPPRLEDGRLYGPGTSDMKGGILTFLWALRCMKELGLKPRRQVVWLLTSDEEIGSEASRSAIEDEARRSQVALVTEPAMPPAGALKTWRKGTAGYRVKITGKAAHAGADPTKGVSAVEELAHHILALQRLTDMTVGTTVNVGVIAGGTGSNVVAAEATAKVDVRFMTIAEGERIDSIIRGLSPVLPGATIKVEGGINRPPMERTAVTADLFAQAQRLGAELGLALTEMGTGGGSDGNFTAAVGCPTIDGLGPCGDGLHTHHEYVVAQSLPERAALAVRLLETL